jgi:ribose transport system ATP-binding protein
MSAPLLTAQGIAKRFLGVQALDRVSVEFRPGEVVAVMGENGAGKSTLMKCLAGVHEPDSGTLTWMGKPVRIASARRAEQLGIAFIHQELNLCTNLDVAGNVFLGRELRRWAVLLDDRTMRAKTAALLDRVGLKVAPETPVAALSIGQQQLVEIARALSQDARMVIMDEPTSSLTAGETAVLFEVVRDLKSQGICVVFISHRIPEVMAVADRVLVLRDGRNSGELLPGSISPAAIVSLMVGRDLPQPEPVADRGDGPVRLEVKGLRTAAWPERTLSFQLRAGEITGAAGLVGAGRTEVARALFGIDAPLAGQVLMGGQALPPGNPRAAIAAGLVLVPEDRKEQGLILDMAIRDNLSLPGLGQFQRAGFLREHAIDAMAMEMIERLSVRTTGSNKAVGELSGGNQQKVALGRWLVLAPKVIMLDEPTRGVDVGSKREIYALIESLAARGAAVLVISSDLEEVLRISDRIMVLHEGSIAGILKRAGATEESVMRLATGATPTIQESAA